MWFLKNATGDYLYLKPNKKLTFGRKKSDIILDNDESISRLHASLCIEPKEVMEVSEPISVCKLKDMGSKYGTYILGDKVIKVTKEGCKLNDKDQIRFGLQQHIFTVTYVPIITVTSTLNGTEKNKLQSIMNEVDGMITTEWINTCTHLTVSKVMLTEKVTCAMVLAVPIVTMDYWKEVVLAFANGKPLPKTDNFVPIISEEFINKGNVSLSPNVKRKTLFQDLILVFFSKRQYKMYSKIVIAAGGKSFLYSKTPLSNKELLALNVLVVQYPDSNETQSTQCRVSEYEQIYNLLQENKRRLILDYEIPLAILHCSIDKYCNPQFNFGNLLKRSQLRKESSEVLALDTQDVSPNVRILPKVTSDVLIQESKNAKDSNDRIIIPESIDSLSSIRAIDADDESNSQEIKLSKTTATKCIPETIDSLTSAASISGGIERRNETSKIIPETNDFSSVFEPVPEENNEISISQITKRKKDISDSITEIHGPSIEKPTCTERSVKYIPETNDSFHVSDIILENNGLVSEQDIASINKEKDKNVEESISPRKTTKFIPETCDSASNCDSILQKNTETSICKTPSPNKKNRDTQKQLQSLDKVNDRPPNDVIAESMNDDFECQDSLVNTLKPRKSFGNVQIQNESDGAAKVCDVIDISMEGDVDVIETTDKRKKSKKRSRETSYKLCSDEEFSPPKKKSNVSRKEIISKSLPTASTSKTDTLKDSSSFLRHNSSFLRSSHGYKIFKKVYTAMPKRRITLDDMYVWNEYTNRTAQTTRILS